MNTDFPDAPKPLFSDEAERGFLSCLLYDPQRIDQAATTIPPDMLFQPGTQIIYRAILRLNEQGIGPDTMSVGALLREGGNLDKVGGIGCISEIQDAVPSVTHFDHYAAIIRRDWFRRQLVERARTMIDSAQAFGDAEMEGDSPDVSTVLAQAEESVFSLLQQYLETGEKEGPVKADDFIGPYLEHVQKVMANVGKVMGMSTGFPDLDRTLCGLDDTMGELFTIAARPGHGKTAFLGTLIKLMAIDMQIPTLVFSMEMSRDQLLHRIAFGGFGITTNKARTGMLSQADQAAFGTGIAKIGNSPLWIDETSDLTTADLRARTDLMVRLHGIKLVFIDYIQMIDPVTRIGKSEERLGIKETCKTIHHLKKKHKLIIIAAAQLNQNIEKSPGRRHVLSDIEGSDAVGKYSDFVGFITRAAEIRRWGHLDQKRQEKQIQAWHIARRDQPDGFNGWRSRDVPHPLAPGSIADDDPDSWFDSKKPKHQGKTTTTRQLASDFDGDPETTSVHETTSITMPDGTVWTFDNEKDWDQTAEIQLVKNRNGPTPDLPVRFNRELARFESRTAKVYSNNPAERQH